MSTLLRIVIPACNEAERIEPTVRDYCEVFADIGTIVVITNGCTDHTGEVVSRLQHHYSNLECVNIRGRIGKGGAVRAGVMLGDEPFVGFVDADGSTPALEYRRLFEVCRDRSVDGIIGSRWLAGSVVRRQPLSRRVASRCFNVLVRTMFGLRYHDTQCGAKIFLRAALSEVIPVLEVADFAFDIEVLWRLQRLGKRVEEVPTIWDDRLGSKVRLFRTSASMLAMIVRMRMRASLLGALPYLDLVARKSVIPFRPGGHHVLLIGRPSIVDNASVAMWDELIQEFKRHGFTVTDASTRFRSRRALLWWYVFRSQRDYDAILEFADGRPSFIPAFSVKPCFLLRWKTTPRLSSSAYRALYKRVIPFALASTTVHDVVSEVSIRVGAGLYNAYFTNDSGTIALRYLDAESKTVLHHHLQ